MSSAANIHLSDCVRQVMEGQKAASKVLFVLTQSAGSDVLHDQLQAVLAMQEPERLRAFCRTLQKRLEATA